MPVENYEDVSAGSLHGLGDLQGASALDPRILLALQGDAKRRGTGFHPYANDEYVYYVNDRGVINWSQRGASKGTIQYVKQSGIHMVHPDLRRSGFCMVDEICEGGTEGEEFKRLRPHIDQHQVRISRGRKDRLRFRVPLEDLPIECLRRMITPLQDDHDEVPRAHVAEKDPQHARIVKILQERQGAAPKRSKS